MRRWIERHANLWSFLFLFCLCYCIENAMFTCLYSSLQSIERQFQISSSLSGFIVSISDIGYVLAVVLISYMGGRSNRARWIASGFLLISVACVMIALPHFIFPHKRPSFNLTAINEQVRDAYTIHPTQVNTPSKLLNHPTIGPRLSPWAKELLTKMVSLSANESEEFDHYPEPFDHNISAGEKLKSLNKRDIVSWNPLQQDYMYYSDEQLTDNNYYYDLETLLRRDMAYSSERGLKFHNDPIRRVKREVWNMSDHLRNLMINVSLGNGKFGYLAKPISDEVNNIYTKSLSSEKRNQLMQSARLPFTYCNEVIVAVKKILEMEKCQTVNTNRIAVGIILFSMVLIGIGHCMPWTLGIPIIDDNVKRQNSPLFFGKKALRYFRLITAILTCSFDFPKILATVVFLRLVGPPLGYTLGAAVNRYYFTLSDPRDIKTTDNRWIGAWWLAFLLLGVCLFFPSLVLFFFPRLKREIRRQSKVSLRKIAKEGEPLMGEVQPPTNLAHPNQEKRGSIVSALSVLQPTTVWSETKSEFAS
ncbi:hypothetical protein M513_11148 [Trichuris suis]|uniref:Major facilitator superfamily (MFS) profile domain-containing protein n=1 Tax=Trichuris suis TaxID=68888 RepID=A0A085LSM5_9BILA|nr:hypothetical protein M513_11148 [Trichuris suis]